MSVTSIEDREERIEEIDARLSDLDEEFDNSLMTDEAREEWNRLNTERDEHVATVAELRARKTRLQEVVTGQPGATERASGSPAFVRKRSDDEIYDMTKVRAESRSEDDYRTQLQDNAKRAIERASFPVSDQDSARTTVVNLLSRVDGPNNALSKRILATGSPAYDRAFGKALMNGPMSLSGDEQRALSVGSNPDGGFAAPFQLDPTVLLTTDGSLSPLRQISRVEQITGKTWQGITSEGIEVFRSGEAVQNTGNEFQIAQPTVTPTRVIADVRFSIEIDQDWAQLRSEITRLLADAKDQEENEAFVNGTGTGVQPGGVVETLHSTTSEVETETSGAFSVDDLYTLEGELGPRFRGRASFLANKGTYNTIRGFATGSDGSDLWVRLGAGQPPELLGYPAYEASPVPTFASGDAFLVFGDFSQFLIVDKLGMSVELNPHVVGDAGRWTGERAVVAAWRNSSRILVDNAFRYLIDS